MSNFIARNVPLGLKKWYYQACRWNRVGLMLDDTLRTTPAVQEAIRRLPEDVKNLRAFRIKRALDLSLKHRILPQDQWTKYEEEIRYLKPYVEQVEKEWQEKRDWDLK